MATVEKLTRNTTSAEVARILRHRILGGHYEEDQFIRQEGIARELGVSRLPVREALALLENEGLVVREKYKGALIPKLSVSEITEIYALRGMLEPYLMRAAISNIDEAALEELSGIIERSRNAQDLTEWADLNQAFHRKLYEHANKPLSLQVLDNLLMRADRYLKMQRVLSTETQRESDAEHQHLLDLIVAGDTETALAALEKHIAWNEKDVLRTVGLQK
jgi:DNA-binding GntR family transcriptional regulator